MGIFSKPEPKSEATAKPAAPVLHCIAEIELQELRPDGSFVSLRCGAPATQTVRVTEQTYDTVEQFTARQPEASFVVLLPFCDAHAEAYNKLTRDGADFGRVPVQAFHEGTQRLAANLLDVLYEVFDASDEDIAKAVDYLNRQRLAIPLPPLRPHRSLREL